MDKRSRQRVAFTMIYNKDTSAVVRMTIAGKDAAEIRRVTGISVKRIAAIKANLSRNTYYPFAHVNYQGRFCGTCRY